MFQRLEGFFSGHGDVSLFFQIWQRDGARGTVLITHGQGEHSDSYARVVHALEACNVNVWAWDLRGHGRSEGKRGYASSFEDYVLDAKKFFDRALGDPRVAGKPVVLLSHSMGGLIQLKILGEQPGLPVTAQVCSAPFLGFALHVPAWKRKGAVVVKTLAPKTTMWNEIRNDQLTRDPDVAREFELDVLRHGRISAGVYLGFEPAFEATLAGASSVKTPTLFQIPESDPVVSSEAAIRCFEALGSEEKELKTYGDGARHEMYNDIHRQTVLKDMTDFVTKTIDKSGGLPR